MEVAFKWGFIVQVIFYFLWEHWAHPSYFENRILLKPALGGVCSLANYSVAYERTQSNRVSDFRDFMCFQKQSFLTFIQLNSWSLLIAKMRPKVVPLTNDCVAPIWELCKKDQRHVIMRWLANLVGGGKEAFWEVINILDKIVSMDQISKWGLNSPTGPLPVYCLLTLN